MYIIDPEEYNTYFLLFQKSNLNNFIQIVRNIFFYTVRDKRSFIAKLIDSEKTITRPTHYN